MVQGPVPDDRRRPAKAPTIAVVLGTKGGQASCSPAFRGKHVQLATASGSYGRATCTGELPAGRH
ncbi:hypothetical protein [Streptomyces sp. NPDC005408]|uniref:hypothetical protein n=1 Tax=Streptomyces sp. NPDC005408 TaxID=3155341 RepID=UPI0033AAB7B2